MRRVAGIARTRGWAVSSLPELQQITIAKLLPIETGIGIRHQQLATGIDHTRRVEFFLDLPRANCLSRSWTEEPPFDLGLWYLETKTL